MKLTLRALAITTGLGALTALGACSQTEPEATPTPPTISASTPSVTPSPTPTPSQSSAQPLAHAAAVPGLNTLSEVTAARGSKIVGRIQVKRGELVITVICRGHGELVVTLDPTDRFTVPCNDILQPTRNQIEQSMQQELKISVAAAEGVEWSLRAQQ